MSVFSMIKRGRQAAKDHRAEQAKKEKEEEQKPPYKHVPKHAAIDAMSGGPAAWRETDRARIVEQNRRRSAMTASGVGMSGVITPIHPGVTRVHSSLSHVSYPSAYATPVVQLPRGYSYSSMPAGWTPHSREMSYSPVDTGALSVKGKEVERVADSSRTSRSSSKLSMARVPLPSMSAPEVRDVAPSPVESSGGSTSSQDDLEMKPAERRSVITPLPVTTTASSPKPSRPTNDVERIHRLHPGRARRISDPKQPVTRPPYGRRTSSLGGDIPPVPALPPMEFGTAITTPDVFSSAESSASSITMVPVGSSVSLSSPKAGAVPTVMVAQEVEVPQQAEIVSAEKFSEERAIIPSAVAAPVSSPGAAKKSRRISKIARFTELEPIKSNTTVAVEPSPPSPEELEQEKGRSIVDVTALPTSFDDSVLSASKAASKATAPPSSSRSGKLTKSAGANVKPAKKNRWSLRTSKTAVAV
ncbi:uncharacterized protein C8A04DRAFT_25445 [Dichotomopilus funicola]|uniref:Uncharacterized protein n=1 Tax=Dichotomopilus funicola TaxID=1934379 RepID=A0AAN6VB34_9PEZI|nr:hypothetical protein C8A04DRAFT_25445 [Dichotomopilus funicola]